MSKGAVMAENGVKCTFRAKYDQNPKSLLSRFWRWHINFCPGFKKYFKALSRPEQLGTSLRYNFKRK